MLNNNSLVKYFLFAIFTLSYSILFSQLSTQKTNLELVNFGEQNVDYIASDGYIDEDGNNIMLFSRDKSVGIALIDSNNNVQWAKEISSCQGAYIGQIIRLSNGNYFGFIGQNTSGKAEIFSFNKLSHIQWHKEISDAFYSSISQCVELSNGNVVMIGLIGITPFVMAINSNGNQIWSKSLAVPGSGQVHPKEVIVTSDNNILLFSSGGSISNGKSKLLLTKMAPNGNNIWEKNYEFDISIDFYNNAIQTSNGNIYLVGSHSPGNGGTNLVFDAMVKKFDENGNYLKGYTYGYQFNDEANDIKEDQNGDLLIIGTSRPRDPCGGNLYVIKLNQNLDTLFTRNYGTDAAVGAFYKTLHKKGNLFYAYGSGSLFSSINSIDAHFIKTTNNFDLGCYYFEQPTFVGNLPAHIEIPSDITYTNYNFSWTNLNSVTSTTFVSSQECFSGTLDVVGIRKLDSPEFELFPNPANHLVVLKSNSLIGKLVEITLLDISGKFYINYTKTFPGEIVLDVSGYSPGAYLIQIKTSESVVNKKLFIL